MLANFLKGRLKFIFLFLFLIVAFLATLFLIRKQAIIQGNIEVQIISHIDGVHFSYISLPIFEKTLKENAAENLKSVTVNITSESLPQIHDFSVLEKGAAYDYSINYGPNSITIDLNIRNLSPKNDQFQQVVNSVILTSVLQQKGEQLFDRSELSLQKMVQTHKKYMLLVGSNGINLNNRIVQIIYD